MLHPLGLVTAAFVAPGDLPVQDQAVYTVTAPDAVPEPEAPVSVGADTQASAASGWDLGLAIRARYDLRFNAADAQGKRKTANRVSFDTVVLTADYNSERFFASGQYRFYGGSFIYGESAGYDNYPGEIQFLAYAYGGIHVTPETDITLGLQPVPFDDRWWGSSFLNTLGFVYGMEETYNTGIKLTHKQPRWQLDVGYFPNHGPAGRGISRDSSRYSTNIVEADGYVPDGSLNAERDMIVGSLRYTLVESDGLSLSATGSVWSSTIRNRTTHEDGDKRMFAGSLKAASAPWHGKLLVAHQDIEPRNPGRRDMISVGGYDSSYNIAAKGTLGFAEVGYDLKSGRWPWAPSVYANYARFFKEADGFRDSERVTLGAFWTANPGVPMRIWSELYAGRNDPYTGAGQFLSGAAQGGDDRWKTSFLVIAGWYF